jgi:hypothetical protein
MIRNLFFLAALGILAALTSCNRSLVQTESRVTIHNVDFYDILKYAIMSQIVYKPNEQISNYYDPYDIRIGTLPGLSIKYLILTDPKNKTQYLAIQGTRSFKSIMLDMEFTKIKDSKLGFNLHRGFDKASRELFRELMEKNLLNREYEIDLTGHSLGGAVAVITAMYLKDTGYQVNRVVTFGQPKITDRDGAEKCRELSLLRVVNHHDEIPMLPSGNVKSGYVHFGPEVLLLRDYYYVFIENAESEITDAPGFLENFKEDNLYEHHLRHYFRNLTLKLSKNIEVPFREKEKYLETDLGVPAPL